MASESDPAMAESLPQPPFIYSWCVWQSDITAWSTVFAERQTTIMKPASASIPTPAQHHDEKKKMILDFLLWMYPYEAGPTQRRNALSHMSLTSTESIAFPFKLLSRFLSRYFFEVPDKIVRKGPRPLEKALKIPQDPFVTPI